MITVKIKNCTLNNRSNQNYTFFFSEMKYGLTKDQIDEKWIKENINELSNKLKLNSLSKIELTKY